MFDDRDDARHPASEQRLREARAAGQIPLSRDLAGMIVWLGAAGLVAAFAGGLWQALQFLAVPGWSEAPPLDSGSLFFAGQLATARSLFLDHVIPLLAAIAGIAVFAYGIQTRFGLFPRAPAAGIRHMGLAAWARRAAPQRAGLDAAGGLLKFLLLLPIAWWVLAGDVRSLLELGGPALESGLGNTGTLLAGVVVKLCAAACLVGLADYALRWRIHQWRLQMTDEEVRQEHRATEAPAAVRRRRHARPVARELSQPPLHAGRTTASGTTARNEETGSGR